jgi:hypothetical protein
MVKRLAAILPIMLLALIFACSQGDENGEPGAEQPFVLSDSAKAELEKMNLTDVERRLVDTLLQLWSQRNNVASVSQAADMLGMELSDETRASLLGKLREHPDLHSQLRLYRPWTFILTANEKKIAQYLVSYQKDYSEFPTVEQISDKIGLPETQIVERLDFLAEIKFLYDLGGTTEFNDLGYSFGARMGEAIFDMGLRFHTLNPRGQKPFNVGCANEAFYKILRDYPEERVRYETIDPLTLEPVTVVFENSKVIEIEPDSAMFVKGWFRGANNLFANRQNASIWRTKTPNLNNPPFLDIREHVAQLRAERDESDSES